MKSFILPAGSRIRFSATASADCTHLHRWHVELSPAADEEPAHADIQSYVSQIGRGEDQRIEVVEQRIARKCLVWASHRTSRGWEPDVAQVVADTPDALTIAFVRPEDVGGFDATSECMMTFHFSHALAA